MEGYIAEIRLFAADFAPRNWAYCQGQLLAIASNSALFSLLGTTYGGNGIQTFALPDLRGRTVINPGNGGGLPSFQLGQAGGEVNHTLSLQEMAAHNHPAMELGTTTAAAGSDPTGTSLASGSRGSSMPSIYSSNAANTPMGPGSVAVDNTGGNQPHNNMQPYLGMNYIICLIGMFPSRN
jgi:microcystin-dependent protein